MKVALLIAVAATLLVGCTATGSPSQLATIAMIEALEDTADTGLSCLLSHSVLDPKVTYDVIQTDSLIDPVLGVIEVETSEVGYRMPDGTPIVTIHSKYELTFTYQDGDWLLKDLEFVQGRRPGDDHPIVLCFH